MEVVFARCAGLDVHKKTVVACVLVRQGRDRLRTVETFGTTTPALLALQTWLTEHQVTHVAMESTGSYGKPVFNLLESRFTTWLVNPAHIQAVPGRKTDVKDAEWIADLLPHGLLRPSFIPDRAQRELRELTRYRKSVIEERARDPTGSNKVLEGANIKLASVVSDVRGVSGSRILAALADERVRASTTELVAALTGQMGAPALLLARTAPAHGRLGHPDPGLGCGGGDPPGPFGGPPGAPGEPPGGEDPGGGNHPGGGGPDGGGLSECRRADKGDRPGSREP